MVVNFIIHNRYIYLSKIQKDGISYSIETEKATFKKSYFQFYLFVCASRYFLFLWTFY